jgi:hypothetical protein
VKRVLVGLALALTLSACGGIQKAADAVNDPSSVTQVAPVYQSHADFVREYVNENTSLNWDAVPDSMIDQAATLACQYAGADLSQAEFFALLGTTARELHISNDDASAVLAAFFAEYCPNTTIDGQAF